MSKNVVVIAADPGRVTAIYAMLMALGHRWVMVDEALAGVPVDVVVCEASAYRAGVDVAQFGDVPVIQFTIGWEITDGTLERLAKGIGKV